MTEEITNLTEFPYQLSIHGSTMLLGGIRDWHKETKHLFDIGLEDGSYCALRTGTAINETKKLKKWLLEIPSPLVKVSLLFVDEVLEELTTARKKFSKIGFGFNRK